MSCDEVQEELERYCRGKDFVRLTVQDLDGGATAPNGTALYITPAIWVNDKLWSMGRFDVDRFDERIHQMIDDLSNSRNGNVD